MSPTTPRSGWTAQVLTHKHLFLNIWLHMFCVRRWWIPVRWQESRAQDPWATVCSSKLLVNCGGPCIFCSRDCRACFASGLRGTSRKQKRTKRSRREEPTVLLQEKKLSHLHQDLWRILNCHFWTRKPFSSGPAWPCLLSVCKTCFLMKWRHHFLWRRLWGVCHLTFHFCAIKNFFIFSLDRLLVVVTFPEENFSIHGWARPSSQDILFLRTTKSACVTKATSVGARWIYQFKITLGSCLAVSWWNLWPPLLCLRSSRHRTPTELRWPKPESRTHWNPGTETRRLTWHRGATISWTGFKKQLHDQRQI